MLSTFSQRPRVVVNGIRRMRTFHYFWCHRCQRTIRLATSNPFETFCPYCFRDLTHELDILRPRLFSADHRSNFSATAGLEPSPTARVLNTLAAILDPSTRHPNINNLGISSRTTRWESESEDGRWITLHFVEPPPQQRMIRPAPEENVVPRVNNYNAIFEEPTVEEFIDDTAQTSDRPGHPPVPAWAIEALPKVKITENHLLNDTHCPICKDEFEVDGEARELPCKHLYHSDCIVPWLSTHNTCPVCRYEIKDDSEADDGQSEFGIEDVANGLNWFRTRLLSSRPVRAFSDWTRRYLDFLDSRMTNAAYSLEGTSWWPSWLIL